VPNTLATIGGNGCSTQVTHPFHLIVRGGTISGIV